MTCRCATRACGHCRERNARAVDQLVAAAEALAGLADELAALPDAPTHRRLEPRHDLARDELRELARLAAPLAEYARPVLASRDATRARRVAATEAHLARLDRSGWSAGRLAPVAELRTAPRRGPQRAESTTTKTGAARRAGG